MSNFDAFSDLDPDVHYLTEFNNSSHCDYVSINDYEQLCESNSAYLKLINYNVRSFRANAQNFLDAFNSCLPQVLVLTETWFSNNYATDIEGYDSFHTVRPSRRSGGVSIFVDS